jgi:hypothetical protein
VFHIPPIDTHDPQFAEIEHIFKEVGVKFRQVHLYLPEFGNSQTAICINNRHTILANLINGKLMVYTDMNSMKIYPTVVVIREGTAQLFDLHYPGTLLKLAQYLRKKKVLSLIRYWIVRLKLRWNK